MIWVDLTRLTDTGGAKHVVLFGDLGRDEIIVDTDVGASGTWPEADTVPERLEYDSNDRFDVQGPGDSAPVAVDSIAEFEKALAEYLAVAPDDHLGTGACLEWDNYLRARTVALIRLWRDC